MISNIRYYYFRDRHNHPLVTLCKIVDGQDVGYGWAICSSQDNPCKKVGRAISLQRAKNALEVGGGTLCDDTQHTFRWNRPILRLLAINVLCSCDGTENVIDLLWRGDSTKLSKSMRP